jgi:hypothetical protein
MVVVLVKMVDLEVLVVVVDTQLPILVELVIQTVLLQYKDMLVVLGDLLVVAEVVVLVVLANPLEVLALLVHLPTMLVLVV